MNSKKLKIKLSLAQSLLNYLQQKPFNEVNKFIQIFTSLQQISQTTENKTEEIVYEIEIEKAQIIFNYLQIKPYIEVFKFIYELEKLEEVDKEILNN